MAQFGRPISDVSTGSWTTTTLWSRIDEVTASDTDFIQSANNPSNDTCEVALTSSLTDPSSSASHTVRYRANYTTSGGGSPPTITLECRLMQGTTQIATQTTTLSTGSAAVWQDLTFTLSGAQADSITDYTDLRLRFIANKSAGARTAWVEVSWAELEVPNAAASYTLTCDQGTFAYTGNSANTPVARTMAANTANYPYTGNALATNFAINFLAEAATFAYTGYNVGIGQSYTLVADVGAYPYTGYGVTTQAAFATALATANFSYSGAELLAPVTRAPITLDAATFSYSGSELTTARVLAPLVAAAATFSYSGSDAQFPITVSMIANPGSYTYNGSNLAFQTNIAGVTPWKGQIGTTMGSGIRDAVITEDGITIKRIE